MAAKTNDTVVYPLRVENLCKEYPEFSLKNVSFTLKPGTIMGFIGRNGAGKTTTLKAIMNLIHSSSGSIEIFGMNFTEHENDIKQRIGFATGGIHYYQKKRIKDIISITKGFYKNWDDEMCNHYMQMFALDENKKLIELSEGMKVKFNLTIALSHHADLLILDEPTSGLDPISRDELLEIFLDIVSQGVSILFSTHITSDLDKCADYITYIKHGEIITSESTCNFVGNYRLVTLTSAVSDIQNAAIIGISRNKDNDTALIHKNDEALFSGEHIIVPDLESVMVHMEKEANKL